MGVESVVKKDINFLAKLFARCDICSRRMPDVQITASFGSLFGDSGEEHYYLHRECADIKIENPTIRQERAQIYFNNGQEIVADYLSHRLTSIAELAKHGFKV